MTNEGRGLVLSWPVSAADAILEQSPLLSNSGWSPVSRDLYQSNSTSFSYKVSEFDGTRVFRIRRLGPAVPGQTGHWGMDEGTGAFASEQTGSASRLQVTNAAWGEGRLGGALSFNGQTPSAGGSLAWVDNANHQVLPPDGRPFSFSLWFKPRAVGTGSQILAGNESDGTRGWTITLESPGPGPSRVLLSSAAGATPLIGTRVLIPGQWYQLTVTSQAGMASLYLDSARLAEGPLALSNSQRRLYLGGLPGAVAGFTGWIDEVRAFSTALSHDQISTRGEWRFDEGAGNLAYDRGFQGHVASVPSTNAWAPGKTGQAIDPSLGPATFSNHDYRVFPASGGAFSVSMWVKPHVPLYGPNGLLSCEAGTNGGWRLVVNAESSGRTWVEFSSTNSGGTLALSAPVSIPDGIWSKLDLTYNGAMGSLYLNGIKVASDSGAIRGCEAPVILGGAQGAAAFDGLIDELKIYGRERAESEIGPVAQPLWEMALVNTSTNLVLPASGPAGKPLTFSILTAPALGTLDFSPNSPRITYRAGAKRGPDSFVYTVSDGEFTSPPATGAVSVVQPHWVSPAGGPTEPRDGSSPDRAFAAATAAQLDAIWRTNTYYDCFFYAPGDYPTTGWKFLERSTANPGCKHIGSGSDGTGATTIRLVDTWSSHGEGVIFGVDWNIYANDFEVHNMVLDCNATNNPKTTVGEPVWLRIPLSSTGWVETVTLHWSDTNLIGNAVWKIAPPAEFTVCTRTPGTDGYITNCSALVSTGRTDVVRVAAATDELLIKLTRRSPEAHFYGLESVEVFGTPVSLPTATGPGGADSQLDPQQSILMAADADPTTAWASGPEAQVQLTIPLDPGTVFTAVDLQWNCKTLPDLRRLGPAGQFFISARDLATGQLKDIPFVSTGRSTNGLETLIFGTTGFTNSVTTDQLVILLASREAGVDFYSLSEVKLKKGSRTIPAKLPRTGTVASLLNAFDGNPKTRWTSGTQGAVTAVDARGNNLKFTKLKVIGFGTTAQRECFPLAVFVSHFTPTPPGGSLRNILVEDCVFTQPAPRNADGISAVAIAGHDDTVLNAVIRRCTVTGLSSHFIYSHAFVGNMIEDSFVDDCQVGVYFEPEVGNIQSMGRVMVRSNVFMNVDMGVQVYFQPGAKFDTLICDGNEIVLRARGGYGIGACDTCSSGIPVSITNLTVLNNVIRYPEWNPRTGSTETGLAYSDIRHAVYANNLVTLGTSNPLSVRPYPVGVIPGKKTKETCDNPGLTEAPPATIPPSLDALLPGYRRAYYNNRDLSGALVPVRHRVMGVDREALQQQWQE